MAGYDAIIAEAARRFQVPESHIRAVMQVESGGRQDAISGKGAGGLMQIMPATYEDLRRNLNDLGPDRFDPRNNIMGGTAYMRQMYDQFGNWDDALSAYNAGPGRMTQVRAGQRGLPAETRNYVPKVNSMIPTLARPRPGQTIGQGVSQGREAELRGLLDFEQPPAGNHLDGLGVLANTGQTPQQSPRPGEAVGSRIDELIGQLSQPYDRGPQMTPGQYQIAGMTGAATQLAGIHNRKVGFGELLGALGGGLVKGTQAGEEAQRQQRAAEFGELGNLSKLQQHQRGEATAAAKVEAARRWAARARASGDPQQIAMAAAVENDPSLLDNIIGKQAEAAFPKDERTPLEKNAAAAGLIPGTPAHQKFMMENAGAGARINLNTTENRAANALAEGRVKRYEEIRGRGENAGKMLGKLQQLETVLEEIGSTGPGTPALSKIIGWARQAGIPTGEIKKLYEDYTGNNMADPAKVDLAQKLIQDFVTNSIKTLGANPTDTDLMTLQQANPSITNQMDANRYIIQNSLRPQLEYDRDLWNDVRGIDRKDQTLDTLEERIHAFEQRKAQAKADAKQQDSQQDSQQASPQNVQERYPNARQAPDKNWYVDNPNFDPAQPISEANPKYFRVK